MPKMILPTKYENIKENPLIVGYQIISLLKNNALTLLDIHLQLKKHKKLELDYNTLIDTLTFLYLADAIEIDNNIIIIKNDTPKAIYDSERFI